MNLDEKDIDDIIKDLKDYVTQDRPLAIEASKVAVMCDIAKALERIADYLKDFKGKK